MSYKIAFASDDGQTINQHFGRAKQFLIWEIEEPEANFCEGFIPEQSADEAQKKHDLRRLELIAEGLLGCRTVLAGRIGRSAEVILQRNGIDAFAVEGTIAEALKRLRAYYAKGDMTKRNL